MNSKTNNRVIVIHFSEIVRVGLYSLIKDIFDVDSILLANINELNNYSDITNSQIVILVNSEVDHNHLSKMIASIEPTNSIKSILVRPKGEISTCRDDCDCCFTLDVQKSRLIDLLNPYLRNLHNADDKKNSAGLSDREKEVVKLVATGKTNKEIANELCISFHTVISHRKNITEKLGIKSISGLTVYAILNNLIDTNTMDPNSLI